MPIAIANLALAAALAAGPAMPAAANQFPNAAALVQQNARFAPTELKLDLSALPPAERAALAKMVEAARLMDAIFLRQGCASARALLAERAAIRPEVAAVIAKLGNVPVDIEPIFTTAETLREK